MILKKLLTCLIAASVLVHAGAIPHLISHLDEYELIKRQTADPGCVNSPLTRGCWSSGFSISTDYEAKYPNTGKVVEYSLEVSNTTIAPDGTSRLGLIVNGKFPGPVITANWGDTLRIHVKNNLKDNGTSIHWHGLRQSGTNQQDGTNGVTECPLAPGDSKTYEFLCAQYGTSWYHSHFSAQYGDGILGTIQINGPTTQNYDFDLGTLPIQDWYYATAFQESIRANVPGPPPVADNALINGTMKNAAGQGSYHKNTITKGKKYKVRIINTSLDNHFKVHLDGHNLTVVSSDLVPVIPYPTDWLFVGIGQRHDVIINANQAVGNYWFRAEVQSACGANKNNGNIKAIFSYDGAPASDPTSTATAYTQSCADEAPHLVPSVKKNVPSDTFVSSAKELDVNFAIGVTSSGPVVQWNINGSIIDVDWEKPTLQYIIDGNNSYPRSLNLIEVPQPNTWSFWVIQAVAGNVVSVPHPIHLHGHDFYILGIGSGIFNINSSPLQFTNPPRRDVAMLPANGYLVIAFITDNPGAWLMHCHIAWHVGEGLAVQFLERKPEILATLDTAAFESTCKNWDKWYLTATYKKDDSGL